MIAPDLSLSLCKAVLGKASLRQGGLCACTCAMAGFDGSAGSSMVWGQVVARGALECSHVLGWCLQAQSLQPCSGTARVCPSLLSPVWFPVQNCVPYLQCNVRV